MRQWIIKILFRLLNPNQNYQDINDKRILEFLRFARRDRGFQEYYRKRSYQIIKTLASGLSRDNYLIWLGHRLELLNLLDQTEKAEKRSEQKLKDEPKK